MTTLREQTEMHPSRWGDPARAGALPETARGLIEMVFGLDERPALAEVGLPAPAIEQALLDELAGTIGAEHVLNDEQTRRLRTRGKSTPDLLRQRTGDLSDAPDAVVRPGSHDDELHPKLRRNPARSTLPVDVRGSSPR